MTDAGRLLVYGRESHLEIPEAHVLSIGDTFVVVRGNGPREGDRMGTATVTAIEEGQPVLSVDFES